MHSNKFFWLFIVFLTLIGGVFITMAFTGCELFNGPADPEYLEKLYREVAWANAEKLTVTMVYPQEWGSGTDRFFDNVRTNEIPRMGYPFTVQFNPTAAFGDAQWRAYRTADLPAPETNWFISTASLRAILGELNSEDELLRKPLSDEVIFSTAIGSNNTVTINIPDDITIIPWSYMQPRITNSNPPLTATYQNVTRSANRDILVTFAAQVSLNSLVFAPDFIEITGDGKDITPSFSPPSYDFDTHTMTIQSRGNIDVGINIEVKLGTKILSTGDFMGMNEPVTFSWRTVLSEYDISGLNAFYNAKENQIEINWDETEIEPRVRYRMNNGIIDMARNDGTKAIIPNVYPPDYSGIREGRSISGFNSYSIFLDLGDNTKTVKIWNIPGMTVSESEPIMEINSPDDIADIPHGASGQYVLLRNIEIDKHTPIGTESTPFTGNFYGNGFTITINEMNAAAAMGLFGVVNGSIVRDLILVYAKDGNVTNTAAENAVTVNPTGTMFLYETPINYNLSSWTDSEGSCFGGIIGSTSGKIQLENIRVLGSVKVTGNSEMAVGGFMGVMSNQITIANGYSGINIDFNVTGTDNAYSGGITGNVQRENRDITSNDYLTNEHRAIDGVTVSGNLSHTQEGGMMYAGGIAGRLLMARTFNDLEFKGTLTAVKTSGSQRSDIGGIAGLTQGWSRVGGASAPRFYNCRVTGSLNIPTHTANAQVRLGGLFGTAQIIDNISNSWVSGNITSSKTGTGIFYCGGLIGFLENADISDSWYENGSIIIDGLEGELRLGGAFGFLQAANLTNCRSLAALVSGTRSSGSICAST